MIAVVLGFGVALTYGTADFFGGLASSRGRAAIIVLWSQMVGLLGIALVAPVAGGRPVLRDMVAGGTAGIVGLSGLILFYRALSGGRMAVVAPTSAVAAAIVPVTAGLVGGEHLDTLGVLGMVVALVGVVLVSSGEGNAAGRVTTRSVGADAGLALAAGVAFGVVFAILGSVGRDSGVWPVLAQRGVSVTVLAVVLLASRTLELPPPGTRTKACAAGLLDTSANALFVLAARQGDLAVAGVLGSLYPVATVVLASRVLREHIRLVQVAGIILAVAGATLLAT